MTTRPLIAGVELGGTKVVCVLGHGPTEFVSEARFDTTTPDATLAAVDAQLDAWRAAHPVAGLGLASFGPLDLDPASPRFGSIVGTPKPGWDGADLRGLSRSGEPVALDTDVNGAALAEARWGAASGLADHIYVTVGTGIGVGAIVNGQPIRGLGHVEAGHLRVPRLPGSAFAGVCPRHGDCVEGLASGPAIAANAGAAAETLPPDHPAWDEAIHALSGLCHNLILTLAPQRILVGGGVGMGQSWLLPRLRASVPKSLSGYAHGAVFCADIERRLAHPALGDRAGPAGALALGLAALEAAGRP